MAHEQFNIERAVSEQHMVDPMGRKWEIKGERENGLVHARPNPDRKDAQIPDEFAGRWTSAALLQTKITTWLKKQWDMAEAMKKKEIRKDHAEKVEAEEKKKTAEQSLAELPDEIKDVLGDTIAVKEEEKPKASKKKVSKKKKVAK